MAPRRPCPSDRTVPIVGRFEVLWVPRGRRSSPESEAMQPNGDAMLDAVDATVTRMLTQALQPRFGEITISFATPDDSFPPADVALPAVNLFLFDVHENREMREPRVRVEKTGDRHRRVYPPYRVDCHYLATAWTSDDDMAGQHRLLGGVMSGLLRHRLLPGAVLDPGLPTQPVAVRQVALQREQLGAASEMWRALGVRPRASLRFTLTVAVDAIPSTPAEAPPRRVGIDLKDRHAVAG